MIKVVSACAAFAALIAFNPPAFAAEDCEARIDKLNESKAEGPDRLAEKDEVAGVCAKQYGRDKLIASLVKACRKYEEPGSSKLQALADCQLAAYGYANAFHSLKNDFRK